MAVYRFKVSFNDRPEVFRIIDVVGVQHFEIFHKTILKSVKFEEGELASFYLNYEDSESRIEISLSEMQEGDNTNNLNMRQTKIQDIINDHNTKLTYVYDFINFWTFKVELIKIIESSTPNIRYPHILESSGQAPDQGKLLLDDDEDSDEFLLKELMSDKNKFDDELEDEDEDEFSYGDDDEDLGDEDEDDDRF